MSKARREAPINASHARQRQQRLLNTRIAPRARARKSCICTIFREGQIRAHRVESVGLLLELRGGQAAVRLDESWACKLRAAPNDELSHGDVKRLGMHPF
jgi:hypothetical protein